jgi:hypothetical protein
MTLLLTQFMSVRTSLSDLVMFSLYSVTRFIAESYRFAALITELATEMWLWPIKLQLGDALVFIALWPSKRETDSRKYFLGQSTDSLNITRSDVYPIYQLIHSYRWRSCSDLYNVAKLLRIAGASVFLSFLQPPIEPLRKSRDMRISKYVQRFGSIRSVGQSITTDDDRSDLLIGAVSVLFSFVRCIICKEIVSAIDFFEGSRAG